MNEIINPQTPKNNQNTPPTKKPMNPYAIIAMFLLAVVALIVIFAILYNKARTKNIELVDSLSEAQAELKLKNDALVALEKKQQEDSGVIANLKKQIEDFLDIQDKDPVITVSLIEEQLSSIKELATKEYWYRNAERSTDKKSWIFGLDMPFSDTSLLVIYEGTIKAGIDLSKVKPVVDEEKRTITILLPAAKILSHELPQETIQVLEVKNNLLNDVSFDDYNEIISKGKEAMAKEATDKGLLTEAAAEAKTAIRDALNLLPGMDTYKLVIK